MAAEGWLLARQRTLLSWSSGKDSAWALHQLRRQPEVELVGLMTTVNGAADRVAMHAVRRELLEHQARAVGLPLTVIELPWPCDNATYEALFSAAMIREREERGIDTVAFGDLFLADVRAYRERMLQSLQLQSLFPLWGQDTALLAQRMIAAGLQARVTCVDPRQVSRELAGRAFDVELLRQLPDTADPCAENGEFHTFAWNGPMFRHPVPVSTGEIVERDGFVFADLLPEAEV